MADDSELSDRLFASRNNWELVSLERRDHVLEEASSSSTGSNEASFYDNKLINVDYFLMPSMDPPSDPIQQPTGDASHGVENVESPPTTPELDWIEPSTPIQSCVIGTSEDDDSSSRSCSCDSREGSAEHLLREKDAITSLDRDPYVGDYTAVLHDMPMDAIQELNIEPTGEMDDESSGEHGDDVPWRRCLGTWLSAAGRASTFCSIALAAAVIGLVLVGSGWQRIRLKYQKFRCRFFLKGKGISQVMYHLVQIKESSSKVRRIRALKAQSCFSGVLNE